jgi:hypothetical protein
LTKEGENLTPVTKEPRGITGVKKVVIVTLMMNKDGLMVAMGVNFQTYPSEMMLIKLPNSNWLKGKLWIWLKKSWKMNSSTVQTTSITKNNTKWRSSITRISMNLPKTTRKRP